MLFNSIAFAIFLPTVFLLYWRLQNKKRSYQNLLILAASYIFYGWWDYRFLSLILISSLTDYIVGIKMGRTDDRTLRKYLLILSLTVNLGILGFFKYYGFFIDSFAEMLAGFGMQPNISSLRIILPVGISFYTFQTLSYTIDIYKRQIPSTNNILDFFAFVSFFPQLVAGPIERAKNLLPQFHRKRSFDVDQMKDGLRQMLWGFFKKVVIADNLARYVDYAFNDYHNQGSAILILGVFFFAIQIYCDFSGYSDIAIGTARLFGFNLMRNFAFPYFSRDIGEFWRRWHISLSSWFRDYVYIPLGGSRAGKVRRIFNIVVTFTVSGLWHGANWTFVAWGFLNGIYYIPLMLAGKQKQHTGNAAEGKILPGLKEFLAITLTFCLTLMAWVFFRAASIGDAFGYLNAIVTNGFHAKQIMPYHTFSLVLCLILLTVEWFQRDKQHALVFERLSRKARWAIYYALATIVLLSGNFGEVEFIYFQF